VERARPFFATILALIPAAPIVAGVAIVSGEGSSGAKPIATATTPTATKPSSTLPAGAGALVAHLVRPTQMRTAPGGRVLANLGLKTGFGSQQFMLVASTKPSWLGVVSPVAGNGKLGWIPQSATSLTRVTLELRVSLGAHSLTISDNHRVLATYIVATGKPSAPTPTGRFAVTDRLQTGSATGPYGCCILALSALSPHPIENWGGGNRIAIHSTPDVSSIGHSVTHGCVRVDLAEGRWLLSHVPLATPTYISS
jgi:lipoprotein-anchoring transpeptidase ErfK/SrfK